jgi:hypothetical protein
MITESDDIEESSITQVIYDDDKSSSLTLSGNELIIKNANGITGVVGLTGAKGIQGEIGEKGEQGEIGPIGPVGISNTLI